MPGSGFIVMFQVPRLVADVIAPPDGESVELMHLTLAYMGKGDALPPGSFDAVCKVVEGFAAAAKPIKGMIGGVGRFNATESSDGMDVWYASYDAADLADFRFHLVAAIEANGGVPVKRNHGFTPHITLKYVYPFDPTPLPKVPSTPLEFTEVVVAMAGETRRFPLGATRAPELDFQREPDALAHLGIPGSLVDEVSRLDEPRLMALRLLGFQVVEKEDDTPREVVCQVLKTDDARHLVYGVVLAPNEIDTQGHVMSVADVEYAAHHYLGSNGVMAVRHKAPADACCVESYIAPIDFDIGDQRVVAGSWVLVSYVRSDELWAKIVDGDYTGYSVGGFGKHRTLK